MPDHVKHTLKTAIVLGEGAPVVELNFRTAVVAGDLRGIKFSALQDPATEDLLKIAGRLCGQPDVVLSKLSIADTLEVVSLVGGFLEAGLETGSKP